MKTKRTLPWTTVGLALVAGLVLGVPLPVVPDLEQAAEAIVGAPLSPVSVAGVARRTAVRSASAAEQQQAAAAQRRGAASAAQAAAAQAQAAASRLPVGTTVSALPSGCTSVHVSDADYFNCGGTLYKPAYQSNNLVYVVSQP